jgi:hypothetical protein
VFDVSLSSLVGRAASIAALDDLGKAAMKTPASLDAPTLQRPNRGFSVLSTDVWPDRGLSL